VATPTGLGAADAILMVRNRTGQVSGQPSDDTIRRFLNAGVEYVERRIGAIWANLNVTIVQGQQSFSLPADLQTIININFSVTLPTATNAVLYPIQLVQEGAFERLVGYAPGQSSGYPTLAFIQTDSSGTMTLQLYPVPQIAGFINVYYQQRPQVYADTTNGSTTTLDTMFQEAMITWACKAVCENRAMYGPPVQYFDKLFNQVLGEIQEDAQRRTVPGRNMVADVMETSTNIPIWYSLPGE
jgi:hypothetical protein